MTRVSLVCVVALVLLGACTASGPRQSALTDEQLLTDDDLLAGDALPWDARSAPALVSEAEAFGLDDDMRAFVADFKGGDPASRLHRMLAAMEGRGLFSLNYANAYTRTARATFHDREGNCLSFTMLFVALARAAGLNVKYQVVDVPPSWNNDLALVVIGSHVNALVSASFNREFVIDFNAKDFRGQYPSREVSDRYAVALFYSNLGAEALVRREYESSFALLQAAARAHADMPGPWVNLGVLYGRNGLYAHAEAAYLRALEADPREQSALANLASVYAALGRTALAEEYRQRIRRYRDANPYYHYGVAKMAYDEKRFEDALHALRSAIRLKRDEDDFYALQGSTLVELGRADSAVASFARAKELARPAADVRVGISR
jgi:tetratricopeptide (TPR) repeat protein